MKKKPIEEIKTPVATIKNNDGQVSSEIFVLTENQCLRFGGVKQDSPRAYFYGPSLIFKTYNQCEKTDEYYINDGPSWKWIEALMQIGAYAMQDKELSKQIPENLKSYWKPKHD